MPRIVEGAETAETDKEDGNQDSGIYGGVDGVVDAWRKSLAALLDACIIQSDVQEGHFQGVLTDFFEDSLGDITILHIPSRGIKSLIHKRIKVAEMCKLDFWKKVLVQYLKESRKRKTPVDSRLEDRRPQDRRNEHRRGRRQSGTPKKQRKSPRRLESEFSTSGDYSDEVPKGSGKENPLVVSAEKEGSKNVSFEGGRVPQLPPPGEQPASPGPGASQALASGSSAASPVNSRFSRTINSDGSVVW